MKRLPLIASIAILAGFSAPLFSRTEIANAAQPQLTVSSDGRVWLVYGRIVDAPVPAAPADHAHGGHQPAQKSGEVYVASSRDGGTTFSPAVKVATLSKIMLGMRRGPRIFAHGDQITVTVNTNELVAFRSTDGGKSWGEPVMINDVATSAREGLHDLAGAADGSLFATWLDLRNGKTELWSATSHDGGRSWGKNEQVYASPEKAICECCHPSALFDADGNLAVMWRNSIEGSRDMWLATRPRGATQFKPATKLGEGTWKLNACPMDGGRIIALGRGEFGAVWQRNGEIFTSRGQRAEVSLGKGKQPVSVTIGGETVVVWQQGTDLVAMRGLNASNVTKRATDARFPSVVVLPSNDLALLAYETGPAKGATTVVVERL